MKPVVKTCSIIGLLAVPLLAQLIWLLQNTQLPVADAAGPLAAAHHLFVLAQQDKFHDFASGLFTLRDWRPTALYLVHLPFLLLTGGQLMLSVAMMTLICTAISITYLYVILRRPLSPFYAALAAAILGLTPMVQWPATYLGFNEVPFMPAMLAFYAHLLRSDYFRSRRHSICLAVALGLAFTLRPAEAFIHGAPILALYIFSGYRLGVLALAEIMASIGCCLFFASLLALAGWWPHGLFVLPPSAIFDDPARAEFFTATASCILAATAILLPFLVARFIGNEAWRKALRERSYLVACSIGTALIIYLFYADFMTQLVEWLSIGNRGDYTDAYCGRSSLAEKLGSFHAGAGLVPVAVALVLAALPTSGRKPALRGNDIYLLLAVIPLPLLLALCTCQYAQRKATLLLVCLMAALLSLGLREGPYRYIRRIIAVCLMVAQAVALIGMETGSAPRSITEIFNGLSYAYPQLVTTRPNPHETLLHFIMDNAQRYGYRTIALPLVAGVPEHYVPIDPFLLQALVAMQETQVKAVFTALPAFTGPSPAIGGEAFLVLSPEYPALNEIEILEEQAEKTGLPSDRAAYALQALQVQGKLAGGIIRERACIILEQAKLRACLYDYRGDYSLELGAAP